MAAASMILFADFVCPFSYVTEIALRRAASEKGVRIRFRAFELYPSPVPLPPVLDAGEGIEALQVLAEQVGVRIRQSRIVPRTRKAHEAARFAAGQGLEEPLREAIYRAYWEGGRDIGRIDVLTSLAGEVGIAEEELKIALDIDAFTDEVLQDRAVAERSGIQHTPTLILDAVGDPVVVVGAQSLADLRRLLDEMGT
jgi:predicted DsbA family dithiol-disulfide isomerase